MRVESGAGEWGGWDSNPGPADYESSPPAVLVTIADLRRYRSARSWLSRFGHVVGMIKLGSRPGCAVRGWVLRRVNLASDASV
jgi:hypothetical protein